MDTKKAAIQIFRSAVKAVDPYSCVGNNIEEALAFYKEKGFEKLYVAAFGKASYEMCRAAEDYMGSLITDGVAVTRYGSGGKLKKIRLFEASHPLSDDNGLKATEKIVELLKGAGKNTLILCLISGGGSSLLVSPLDGISLEEQRRTADLLLRSGADINEVNAVRKHISKIKGGKLAGLAAPAHVISLIISDVVGDHLDAIASGPTAPDGSTFKDAMDILKNYSIFDKAPQSVSKLLEAGLNGKVEETLKKDDPVFQNVHNRIIADNKTALAAATAEAERIGFTVETRDEAVTGDAVTAGKMLADFALEIKEKKNDQTPGCYLSGGETTVTVKGNGKGGRNMELALAFAQRLDGECGITLLSAGTDGIDGVTDAAGAVVDSATIDKAKKAGCNPLEYLDDNDSYSLLKMTGDLLITGPTGTNVTDIQILIVE